MVEIRWQWINKAFLNNNGNGSLAITILFFLFYRDEKLREDVRTHEYIHFRQQLELLFVGMWFIYIVNFLINLLKYKEFYKSYKNVVFEKEAYSNDKDSNYLNNRKVFSWVKYL